MKVVASNVGRGSCETETAAGAGLAIGAVAGAAADDPGEAGGAPTGWTEAEFLRAAGCGEAGLGPGGNGAFSGGCRMLPGASLRESSAAAALASEAQDRMARPRRRQKRMTSRVVVAAIMVDRGL
jgi:hypothetical protein